MALEGCEGCVMITLSIYCVWKLGGVEKLSEDTDHFKAWRITAEHQETALEDDPAKPVETRNWIVLWKQIPQVIVKVLFNLCYRSSLLSWQMFRFYSSIRNDQISLVTLPIILNH